MHIGVRTDLQRICAVVMDADAVRDNIESPIYYPFMYKVVYAIPKDWDMKDPLVVLNPTYN